MNAIAVFTVSIIFCVSCLFAALGVSYLLEEILMDEYCLNRSMHFELLNVVLWVAVYTVIKDALLLAL